MGIFNAIASVLCPGYGIARAVGKDIKENGYDNSTTRKVIKYTSPIAYTADSIYNDIKENGYKNSTTRKVIKYTSPLAFALENLA